MNERNQSSIYRCFGFLLLIMHGSVASENVTKSDLNEEPLDLNIEKVLVIGKHPQNNSFEYPSSVNTMSAEAIAAWNIQGAEDVVKGLANVDMRARSPMSANISIRSVGSENWHINANQSVAQAVDDTTIQGPYASKFAMFDLQGVTVYRGPQTGVFGINSTGGVINFETIKPVMNEFEANMSARIGRDGLRETRAILNLPLVSDLSMRLAVGENKRDPLWFNAFSNTKMGSIDTRAFRTHLQWDVSPNESLLLTYQYGNDSGSRVPYLGIGYWQEDGDNVVDGRIVDLNAPLDCQALLPSNSRNFNIKSNCVTVLPFSGDQAIIGGADDWYTTFDAADDVSRVRFETLKAKYSNTLALFELNIVSAYDTVQSDYIESLNNNPSGLAFMPSQTVDKAYWSHEIRLNSLASSNSVWMFGISYSDSDDYFGTVITRTDPAGAPFGIVPAVSIQQSNQTVSGFGTYDYSISTEWKINASLRYSRNKQSGISTTNVLAKTSDGTPGGIPIDSGTYIDRALLQMLARDISGPCPPNVGGFPCELATPVSLSSNLIGGKIGASHIFDDNNRFYAHFSRGFLAGAFDTRALAAFVGTADDPVEPETLDAIELGWKYRNAYISANLAGFYYLWEDKQTFDLNNEGNPAFLNIPQAKILGVDGEINWQINENWRINYSIGALRSEITDVGNLRFTQTGNELSHTPEWSHSLMLSYSLENRLGYTVFNLSQHYKSSVYDNNANTSFNRLEAQKQWNISMHHQFNTSHFLNYSIEAGVENLSSEKYCHSLTDNTSLSYSVQCRPNEGKAQWYLGFKVEI